MKIRKSDLSNSWEVVDDKWGEKHIVDGVQYTYTPIPVCRVPIGFGQSEQQSYALARKIISALHNLDNLLATELPTAGEIERQGK